MIVVAIIGVLAAVAIPAFSRYVKKSRLTEAAGYLNRMWAGSLVYYESDRTLPNGMPGRRMFPGAEGQDMWALQEYLGTECGCMIGARCPGNSPVYQTDFMWKALNFALPDPHVFKPSYFTANSALPYSMFQAVASADMDCDMISSNIFRIGETKPDGEVSGSVQPLMENELE
jgi:hypothetical protein